LLAACYGLIGIFSIIPFLLFLALFGFSIGDRSGDSRLDEVILILILGWISALGVAIIYWVYRLHDRGRRLMIVDGLSWIALLSGILWRGRIGSRFLTPANRAVLMILLALLGVATLFLFHGGARKVFEDGPS
jgi:uncharacterized membrane protein YhaH (DUF805 family)